MTSDNFIEIVTDRVMRELGRQAPDCTACGHCVSKNPGAVDAIVSAGAHRVGAAPGISAVTGEMARLIDHTLLKPEATKAEVEKMCQEARQYRFASVCLNPSFVPLAADLLRGSSSKVCTVIGFPLGATTSSAKAAETREAVDRGAEEVDMVIHVGMLKSGNYSYVEDDIRRVVQAAGSRIVTKVILETCLLTDEEKVVACELSKRAGADFVKTSTGFAKGGATTADISLMRRVVGPAMGVKASGGIRDRETAELMARSGATRIGASASVAIVTGKAAAGKGY